jgi:Zn-dependent membrane protease YugP
MYYGYDLLLVLIPILIGAWAQYKVNAAYKKYSAVRSKRGYTGAQAARMILDENNLRHVRIEQVAGTLTDQYDPRENVVRLSQGVYDASSISAIGIAAHECGHAVQHAVGYTPMKIRSAIIPITNIGSKLAVPLILIGVLLSFGPLVSVGLIAYALIAVFQLVTLPVEFNASSRAMKVMTQEGILEPDETGSAGKVLSAAALTYVAALISSLTQLLRMFLLFGNRRGRR